MPGNNIIRAYPLGAGGELNLKPGFGIEEQLYQIVYDSMVNKGEIEVWIQSKSSFQGPFLRSGDGNQSVANRLLGGIYNITKMLKHEDWIVVRNVTHFEGRVLLYEQIGAFEEGENLTDDATSLKNYATITEYADGILGVDVNVDWAPAADVKIKGVTSGATAKVRETLTFTVPRTIFVSGETLNTTVPQVVQEASINEH